MKTYAYHVRHKNGWGTGCGPRPTHCHECQAELPAPPKDTCATGYGCGKSEPVTDARVLAECGAQSMKPGDIIERAPAVCYACCAKRDRQDMIETGRATLYLSKGADGKYTVGNWPGSLRLGVYGLTKGRHNMARCRHDFGFTFEGHPWRGTQYGDNTQIAHCRRLKG